MGGKYNHAACQVVRKRQVEESGRTSHTVSCLVTNFSPPSEKRPSLLLFSEVQTFFHEFGHGMHSLLSSNDHTRLNWDWNAVEMDFLEVPSMCFENWVFHEQVLEKSSAHYKTGETLPSEILHNVVKASRAHEAFKWKRLIGMSVFDMSLHSKDGNKKELYTLWRETMKKYTSIEVQQDTAMYASWQHLIGYNSGYYSYLYSEMIAKDLFSVFEEKGILSKQVGSELRKKILEPVCLEEGNTMIRSFLGRDFKQEAFLNSFTLKN